MKLISITLRNIEEKWELGVIRDDTYVEIMADSTEPVEEAIQQLVSFAETVKTKTQSDKETAEERAGKLLELLSASTSEEEKLSMISVYPEYQDGVLYSKDQKVPYVQYRGKLYKIIAESFQSQADWPPDKATSLFTEILPPNAIDYFRYPSGAHDAYRIGDRVKFEGYIWCSIIDHNVYSPEDYPAGWEREGLING